MTPQVGGGAGKRCSWDNSWKVGRENLESCVVACALTSIIISVGYIAFHKVRTAYLMAHKLKLTDKCPRMLFDTSPIVPIIGIVIGVVMSERI